MKCSEAQRLMDSYLGERLPDRQLEPFLKHLRTCASCREDLDIYMAVYSVMDDDNDNENYNFVNGLEERLDRSADALDRRKSKTLLMRFFAALAEAVLIFIFILAVREHREPQRNPGEFPQPSVPAESLTETAAEETESEITGLPETWLAEPAEEMTERAEAGSDQ